MDQHMAVLLDNVTPTAGVMIDDIQVGDPNVSMNQDQERLIQLIWRKKQLLIGKGKAPRRGVWG